MKFIKLPNAVFFISLYMAALTALAATERKEGEFFGAKETEYPAWFKDSFLNLQEDIEEAAGANKRLMLFFYQNGCPYCNAMVERNLAQKDIQDKVRKHLDVVAINMWGDREVTHLDGKTYTEKSLAAALKVQFTPTILFLDESGKTVLRINGYHSPDRFNLDLDFVNQKMENKVAYRDFIKANLPEVKASKQLNSEDFFAQPPYDLANRKDKSRPMAVFFEQKDCPSCDLLHSKVLPAKEIRDTLKKFDVIQLDMWSKTPVTTPHGEKLTAREWAKKLDVKFAPSIVVFNEQGDEVIRSEASFKVFHTYGIFNYVSSGSYKEEPSFQRYLSEFADHFREEGQNVNIWRYADEAPDKQ